MELNGSAVINIIVVEWGMIWIFTMLDIFRMLSSDNLKTEISNIITWTAISIVNYIVEQ